MELDEKPAEGVSAKILRSESRVHSRGTVNGGAGGIVGFLALRDIIPKKQIPANVRQLMLRKISNCSKFQIGKDKVPCQFL